MGWDIVYDTAKIPNVVSPSPVWSDAPRFTVTEGQVIAYPLPVSVSGGASITVEWVSPGSLPQWIGLSSGVSPSITFLAGPFQVDSADLTNVVIRATANGHAVPSDAGTITVEAGAAVNVAPEWQTISEVTFYNTGTTQYYSLPVSDQNNDPLTLTSVGAALPSGVTLDSANRRLVFTGTGSLATTGGIIIQADDGVTDTALTTFTLTSTGNQTAVPFAFGHAFKQGDVPAGSYVGGSSTDWQCNPLTYWPDGSLKHAIIAGRSNVVNGDTSISLTKTATVPTGTALTEADLAGALPTTTIAAGAFTWTLNTSVGSADKFRTVCSGPVMSNFIYRKPVTGNAHLVLWADVRVYKGGNVEIFPWVENCYLTVANPTNDVRDYSVVIGGVTKFSQPSLDIKHHTRIPLVTGTGVFSYWTGTDPAITPKHDRAYLIGTKLVPNYGWRSPSEAKLNSLGQSYTPNSLGNIRMGTAGTSAALIGHTDNQSHPLYITTGGDVRAYRAAIVLGLAGGSNPSHFRDETTNEPFKFTSYPSASLNSQDTPYIPPGTGGANATVSTSWVTHQPSYGYLPFLITGRWWFWEELAFWATFNYLQATVPQRQGANYGTPLSYAPNGSANIINPNAGSYANRGAHWAIRILAQTLALCPTSHPLHADLKAAWDWNVGYYKDRFVDGTFDPGWVSPHGFLGLYGGPDSAQTAPNPNNCWWTGGWEDNFGAQAWGFASDIGIPQTSLANHQSVRNHAYKQIVGRTANQGFAWQRFAIYWYPVGSDQYGTPPDHWFTPAESYTNYVAAWGLNDALLGTTIKSHESDGDIASSSATDYGPFAIAALAYAVDHAATDASTGWSNISGATNWSAFSGLNDDPGHGFVPRGMQGT